MSSNPPLVVIEDKILAVLKYFEMFYLINICTVHIPHTICKLFLSSN